MQTLRQSDKNLSRQTLTFSLTLRDTDSLKHCELQRSSFSTKRIRSGPADENDSQHIKHVGNLTQPTSSLKASLFLWQIFLFSVQSISKRIANCSDL